MKTSANMDSKELTAAEREQLENYHYLDGLKKSITEHGSTMFYFTCGKKRVATIILHNGQLTPAAIYEIRTTTDLILVE